MVILTCTSRVSAQDNKDPLINKSEPLIATGSNELGSIGRSARRTFANIIFITAVGLIAACIDLYFIYQSVKTTRILSARLAFVGSGSADATFAVATTHGGASRAVGVDSCTCELRYKEDRLVDEWVTVGVIDGSLQAETSHQSEVTFAFSNIEYSALRSLIDDVFLRRPVQTFMDCEATIHVHVCGILPIPIVLKASMESDAQASTSWDLTVTISVFTAGQTLYHASKTKKYNRPALSGAVWAFLLSSYDHASFASPEGRRSLSSLASRAFSMFSDAALIKAAQEGDLSGLQAALYGMFAGSDDYAVDYTLVNPLFGGANATAPPMESLVIAVPAFTVSTTMLGDIENGGRYFITSTECEVDLMLPELHLRTDLQLRCSDQYPTAGGDLPELVHCSIADPQPLLRAYRSLGQGRFHVATSLESADFLSKLIGQKHSLLVQPGAEGSGNEILKGHRAKSVANHQSGTTSIHEDLGAADISIERAGPCIEAVADGVFWLQLCVSTGPDNYGVSVNLFDKTDSLLELLMYPYLAQSDGFSSYAVARVDGIAGELYGTVRAEQLVAGYAVHTADGNAVGSMQGVWDMHKEADGTMVLRVDGLQAGTSAVAANPVSLTVVYSANGDKFTTAGQVLGASWDLVYQSEENADQR
jgi:hypothetical protein